MLWFRDKQELKYIILLCIVYTYNCISDGLVPNTVVRVDIITGVNTMNTTNNTITPLATSNTLLCGWRFAETFSRNSETNALEFLGNHSSLLILVNRQWTNGYMNIVRTITNLKRIMKFGLGFVVILNLLFQNLKKVLKTRLRNNWLTSWVTQLRWLWESNIVLL